MLFFKTVLNIVETPEVVTALYSNNNGVEKKTVKINVFASIGKREVTWN
jgi:hypothetical protein